MGQRDRRGRTGKMHNAAQRERSHGKEHNVLRCLAYNTLFIVAGYLIR